jgi:DNA-binding transcriptional regulator YiaG
MKDILFAALFLLGVVLVVLAGIAFVSGSGSLAYLAAGFAGLLMLLGAGAMDRKQRMRADPERRARHANIRRLRQEGLLVSQPDLARELGVGSSTVRRWCKTLGLEPAYRLGRNYYTSQQAELIRRYGSAGSAERREILKELESQPFEEHAQDCAACGAWNPLGSKQCGECGAALEGAEV